MNIQTKLRQIDFLRLFKLCKHKKLVDRKRKMPVEYKNDSEARNACKRLCVSLINSFFPNHNVKYTYYGGCISISTGEREIINAMERIQTSLINAGITIPRELSICYDALCAYRSDYITVSIPYDAHISFKLRTDVIDSFYKCALSCMEFKEFLIKSVATIAEDVAKLELFRKNALKEKEDLQRKKEEERRLKKIKAETEVTKSKKDLTVELKKQVAEQETKKLSAQQKFAEAMAKTLGDKHV